MSGEPALSRSQFPSSVFFVCLTRVNQYSISYGIAFKLGEPGDGPRSLCMNFVVWEMATMIVLIGSKLSLGKGFPINLAKILIFGTSFGASRFGPFGSSVIISCLTTNDGMSWRSNIVFETGSAFTPKRHGKGWWIKLRLPVFQRRRCSKVLTILGGLGMFFVEDTICILSGIGKGKLGRRSSTCLVVRRFKTLDSSSHF